MKETLEALLFGLGDHLLAVHAHRTLLARHGRAPKVQTVRAWLRRWRRENARVLLAVTNPDLDCSRHRPAGGDATASVLRLNQLWELDSTPADVICANGKRYAIVAAIDVWSRLARVLVVPASRATAIAALLRCCILEWGVPEAVRTDEGKDYTSRHVLGVLADLEIEHRPCPPYTPEAKLFVERFLGALTRRELGVLQAAVNHCHAQGYLLTPIKVTLPPMPAPRDRWLTRDEAARLLRAAYRNPKARHLARFILVALYTGTRSNPIRRMQYMPNTSGGWVDTKRGVMCRRAAGESESKRRTPPVPDPAPAARSSAPLEAPGRPLSTGSGWATSRRRNGQLRRRPVSTIAALTISATRPSRGRCSAAPTGGPRPATSV